MKTQRAQSRSVRAADVFPSLAERGITVFFRPEWPFIGLRWYSIPAWEPGQPTGFQAEVEPVERVGAAGETEFVNPATGAQVTLPERWRFLDGTSCPICGQAGSVYIFDVNSKPDVLLACTNCGRDFPIYDAVRGSGSREPHKQE